MKTYSLLALGISLICLSGMGTMNLATKQVGPGTAVSDAKAASLVGAGCTGSEWVRCKGDGCLNKTVRAAIGDRSKNVTGDIDCGGSTSCASYYRDEETCSDS